MMFAMPELPEVESVVRRIRGDVVGRTIRSIEVGRASISRPQRPRRLQRMAEGRRVEAVERRGKNILIRLSGGIVLRIHLRMTGDLSWAPDGSEAIAKSTRALLRLDRGCLVFDDPRALGRITAHSLEEARRFMAELGPEPLSAEFTPDLLFEMARSSRQPAKTFLMDQARVAGIGNIYAAEALHRARIHPEQVISTLSRGKIGVLHESIVAVLRDAVQSALAAYGRPGQPAEAEEFQPAVYGREGLPCTGCRAAIRRIAQAGRSTYFCPFCQKRARARRG
jgi:formamidopyrimidine-DNA glycosylase